MRRVCVTLSLAILVAGCPVPQNQRVPNPSLLVKEPITGRAYKLYISSKYNRNQPAPVIISLHGTAPWDTADRQVREWKSIAEDCGAILICPTLRSSDGIFPAGDGGLLNLLLQDERLVMTILGELHYKFNIDRRNIFLTSWSGGGYPLWFIGLRHPDIFTAICSRQSTFRRGALDGWYPEGARLMPVLIFHGTADVARVVHQSREAYDYLVSQGFRDVRIMSVRGGHARHPEVALKFFRQHWRRGPYRPGMRRASVGAGR